MPSKPKQLLEVLLVKCEMTGMPEKGLLISRNLGPVDLICGQLVLEVRG